MFMLELRGICVVDCDILWKTEMIKLNCFSIGCYMMLPNNKLFVVWVLDGVGLCEDVIRWEILGWLIDWVGLLVEEFGVNWREDLDKCFRWCCSMGYLDVVKWLWKISDGSIDIHAKNDNAFLWGCVNGHLDVARWLWKVCSENKHNGSIDIHNDNTFTWSCSNGHLDVAKWLWKVSNGRIDIHAKNEKVFRWSCEYGRLNVIKWLWKICSENKHNDSIDISSEQTIPVRNIDIHAENNYAFGESCYSGHLKVAKWLWMICPENKHNGSMYTHADNEYTFKRSCMYGNLDVVKWLWEISNEKIDIHAENDYAFRWACLGGHLNIAKWLCKISNGKIDIHAENDYAFRWSCRNGYMNVVKWLWEVSNENIDKSIITEMIFNEETNKSVIDYLKSIM